MHKLDAVVNLILMDSHVGNVLIGKKPDIVLVLFLTCKSSTTVKSCWSVNVWWRRILLCSSISQDYFLSEECTSNGCVSFKNWSKLALLSAHNLNNSEPGLESKLGVGMKIVFYWIIVWTAVRRQVKERTAGAMLLTEVLTFLWLYSLQRLFLQ